MVPLGSGHYHIILNSMSDQCMVMFNGPANTSPGTFRVARWQPGFDPTCLKSTTQVWVRIYGIPVEFSKE